MQGVARFEISRGAHAAHTARPGRAHVGQAEDAAVKSHVGEEMGKAIVAVRGLAAEHLQEVAHVPAGPQHVVVLRPGLHGCGARVDHNLFDGEPHSREALILTVCPNGLLVQLVHAVHQAYEVSHGGLGAGAAHLFVELVVSNQPQRTASQTWALVIRDNGAKVCRPSGSVV